MDRVILQFWCIAIQWLHDQEYFITHRPVCHCWFLSRPSARTFSKLFRFSCALFSSKYMSAGISLIWLTFVHLMKIVTCLFLHFSDLFLALSLFLVGRTFAVYVSNKYQLLNSRYFCDDIWSFKLPKGDVWLPKLFRQTVPQRWARRWQNSVTELVVWSLDHTCSIVSRPQKQWSAAVTSVHSSARYTGDVLASPDFVMDPCDSVETFTFLSSFASVSSTFEAVVPKDFLSF